MIALDSSNFCLKNQKKKEGKQNMAGSNITTRQKMINMMYLVLTALLALNVSKEIIKAFNLMENSLATSAANIVRKNESIKMAIASEANENSSARAAIKQYDDLHAIVSRLLGKIAAVKKDLLALTDGRVAGAKGELVKGGLNELTQGDNMEVHGNYFMKQDGGKNGKILQAAINTTRQGMIEILDRAIADPLLGGKNEYTKRVLLQRKASIEEKCALVAADNKTPEGKQQSWVTMYLENSPLAGVFAILTKVENDALTLESEIASVLAESVGAKNALDSVIPVIRASTSAILTNQTYEAEIVLAAYDSKSDFKMTVNGSPIEVSNGKGIYRASSSNPGEYSFKVGINVPQPGGGVKEITQEGKYSVFAPSAAISADELNVIYEGLPNPLSISVAGVNPNDVFVNIASSSGDINLQKIGPGKFNALCPTRRGNDFVVQVTAKIGDRILPMGSKKFRIRRVPPPQFMLGPYDFASPIKDVAIHVQHSVSAVMPNFVYESVRFTIQSYHCMVITKRNEIFEARSLNNTTSAIAGILSKLKPGDRISFDEIIAIGPGGVHRLASVIALIY